MRIRRNGSFVVLLTLLCASVGCSYGHLNHREGKHMETAGMHRVLFEATSGGDEQWTSVLNNIENVQKALGPQDTQIELVVHGQALGLLMAKDNAQQERIQKIADTGVVFAACENTMRRKNVSKADLLPVATTVDSGVAEVVRKQEAGWSYIKTGH